MVKLVKSGVKLLKVDELKAALKERRCSIGGKKAELVDRLIAHMDTEGDAEEEEIITEEVEAQPLADNIVMIEETDQRKLGDIATESVLAVELDNSKADLQINDLTSSSSSNNKAIDESADKVDKVATKVNVNEVHDIPLPMESEKLEPIALEIIPELQEKQEKNDLSKVETTIEKIEPSSSQLQNEKKIAEPKTTQMEVITETNKEVSAHQKCYVRVDNFQRPLTDKLLFEWLAKTLGYDILPANLWMNKIKTHCYIDFDSLELAQACITAVTGAKVDSKHSLQLVANLTKFSASEAETSMEAKLKPSEWRVAPKVMAIAPVLNGKTSAQPVRDSVVIGAVAAGTPRNSFDQSQVNKAVIQGVASNVSRAGVARTEARGDKISGNEQVGFTTRRNMGDAGISQDGAQMKRQRGGSNVSQESVSARGDSATKVHEKVAEPALELDSLFRKTKSLPPLYWLPVSEKVSNHRKQFSN